MNMKRFPIAASAALFALLLPAGALALGQGQVIEEIVARVNNDIITLSQYQAAEAQLKPEAQQECSSCTAEQINAAVAKEKKNLLRDLIDKSLLVQRAKDLGISVDLDLVKRLDQIRRQNKLPSMDALQRAVEAQGIDWEDYKQRMKDSMLTERVIQREVGGDIRIGPDEIQKYYDTHKSEFIKPEEVALSEILFSTANKTPAQAAAIKQKAEAILKRLQDGDSFKALAQRYSQGPNASQGGELGLFQRGMLQPEIEKQVFSMPKDQITGLIPTTNGYEILKVDQHYVAGLQPLDNVTQEIEGKLYQSQIHPALRAYLEQLRRDSYVVVRPGYVDTAAVSGSGVIEEVKPGSDEGKSKKKKKEKKGA